jgi:hypothetical protein
VLCIVIGLIIVPAASAKRGSTTHSDTEVISTATEEVYNVAPWTGDTPGIGNSLSTGSLSTANPLSSGGPGSTLLSASYITQGKTAYYNAYVGSGVNWIELDLNWGDKSDSLTLGIYTPSGSKVGTYSDSSDGIINGRIHVNVDPSQGYVAQGNWKLSVYGSRVSGQEDYTLSVARH